jgi:hypothetical protein
MSLQIVALTLAAAGLVISASPSPACAAFYGSSAAAGGAARKRAYAECDLQLSHLPRYNSWPQRCLAIKGCVQDLMRRR